LVYRWFGGLATDVEGGPDDAVARRLLAAKYQGWVEGRSVSTWARESLPVAVDLSRGSRRVLAAAHSPPR
jgi:hypothetical protein